MTGSTSWVELSGALIHIGPTAPDRFTEPERTVSISTPRGKPQQLAYTFTDYGKLELTGDAASFPELDKWLVQITAGSDITSKDIIEAAEARGYKRRSAFYWMKEQVALGTIVLVEHGVYRKPTIPIVNTGYDPHWTPTSDHL